MFRRDKSPISTPLTNQIKLSKHAACVAILSRDGHPDTWLGVTKTRSIPVLPTFPRNPTTRGTRSGMRESRDRLADNVRRIQPGHGRFGSAFARVVI
eukprot:406367-Amorphochlora_amoeboformis.AAC.2